jgi:hypothetical protein
MIALFLAQVENNAPYLELTKLSSIPDPLASVSEEILAIAYTITVAGFILHFYQHKDSPAPGFGTLLRMIVVISCITILPLLREWVTNIFYYLPEKLIKTHGGVNAAGDKIRDMLADSYNVKESFSLNFLRIGFAHLTAVFIASFFNFIGFIGSLILIPFYFIQRFGIMLGFAFMPIALACLTLPALAEKGQNYILSVLSILAWPMGFVLSSVCAGSLIEIGMEYPVPAQWGLIGTAIVPFLAAGILIVGTTSTPLLSYYLFTTGGGYLPTPSAGQMAGPAQMAARGAASLSRMAK